MEYLHLNFMVHFDLKVGHVVRTCQGHLALHSDPRIVGLVGCSACDHKPHSKSRAPIAPQPSIPPTHKRGGGGGARMRPSVRDLGAPASASACTLPLSTSQCDNLLCDLRDLNKPVVKIGDMGLSKTKKGSFVSGNMRGTLPWCVEPAATKAVVRVMARGCAFARGGLRLLRLDWLGAALQQSRRATCPQCAGRCQHEPPDTRTRLGPGLLHPFCQDGARAVPLGARGGVGCAPARRPRGPRHREGALLLRYERQPGRSLGQRSWLRQQQVRAAGAAAVAAAAMACAKLGPTLIRVLRAAPVVTRRWMSSPLACACGRFGRWGSSRTPT